jgi:hypothetical protein
LLAYGKRDEGLAERISNDAYKWRVELYTSPPRKEWVGLTANDIVTIRNNVPDSVVGDNAWCFYFTNAIQTKLREQNT